MRLVHKILDSILANIVVATQLVQRWSCWVQHGTDTKQVFGKTQKKERWDLHTISTKVFLALKGFYGRININKSQKKEKTEVS